MSAIFFLFVIVSEIGFCANKSPSINERNELVVSNASSRSNETRRLTDYTLSTRHLFLALLLYFHEKEWLEARIWKTNWEYYDELKKVNQEWAEQFYHLAYFFDEVTYGERNVQKEEYIQFHNEAMKWLGEGITA